MIIIKLSFQDLSIAVCKNTFQRISAARPVPLFSFGDNSNYFNLSEIQPMRYVWCSQKWHMQAEEVESEGGTTDCVSHVKTYYNLVRKRNAW